MRKVDQIRDDLFGGGYPDPVSNAEQLAFLSFFYLVEDLDAQNAARARVMHQSWESLFAGTWTLRNPLNATNKDETGIAADRLRWSSWARSLSGDNLVRFVRDEVFPFYADMATRSAVNFMDGVRLGIDEPAVLTKLVSDVDALRLDQADADTKGDLFEHVLRQIKQAGELGQFRTPRCDPRDRRNHRSEDRRNHLRPCRRDRGFRGRRVQPHPPCAFLAGRHPRRRGGRQAADARSWRQAHPETAEPACQPHLLWQRRRSQDGAADHDESDAARPAQRAHPAPQCAHQHAGCATARRPASAGRIRCGAGQSAILRPHRQGPHRRGRARRHQHRHRNPVPEIHAGFR